MNYTESIMRHATAISQTQKLISYYENRGDLEVIPSLLQSIESSCIAMKALADMIQEQHTPATAAI